ncbi:right-handed parallel beta-helix repeat-containing protein [Pendulispora rubella]|uniref:Right-handed parallel beta-helix repeat-containing protein n=1 Tax=Pendulispora rubella TaxID=2741070 RepID=A0ABZ2KWM1_9BACT
MNSRFIQPSHLLALALLGCGSSSNATNDPGSDASLRSPDGPDGPDAHGPALEEPTGPVVYLSQQGNDDNDGLSAAAPKRTWDAAIDAVGPGGTVYLSGRYYNERIMIHGAGEPGRSVTLRPDPNNRGFVDGGKSNPQGTWREDNLVRVYGHDIVWDGIEIFNSPWNAFGFDDDAARGVIRRTKIHDIYMQPIGSSADDVLVEDNEIYDSELSNVNNSKLEGVWGGGIGSGWKFNRGGRTKNFTVRRNKIRNNWGEDVTALHCDGFVFSDNDISPVTAVGIYTDNAANGVVERNFVHDGEGRSLAFASESYGYADIKDPPHDIVWRNNITRNAGPVVFVRDGRKTYYNLHFIGNTFYNTEFYADQGDEGGVRGNEFVDNILDGNFHLVDMGAWSIHHNDWVRGNAQGANAFTVAPGFVDAGAGSPEGLKIGASSPLRGAGAAHADLPTDYWGASRPAPPSIGAHDSP